MLEVRPDGPAGGFTMRSLKLSAAVFFISLFTLACDQQQPQQQEVVQTYPDNAQVVAADPDEYWAKDNLDLQRVGYLLERSNSPQEFERYLNSDDGLNNLDLDGDGYADYISVDEFGYRSDRERGMSLYSRFGPETIQEIASIVFYRDNYDAPGARIQLRGNENIYGDNAYYETNWLNRTLGIVSTLFSPRDEYYQSPYYYDNYPADYEMYEVVQTPLYRRRIEQLYPEPVFVYTTQPTITQITIDSPYNGRYVPAVYAKLAKPTNEQQEFLKSNPNRPAFVKLGKAERKAEKQADKMADKAEKEERKLDKRANKLADKQEEEIRRIEKQAAKPEKLSNPGKAKGHDKNHGKGKKP